MSDFLTDEEKALWEAFTKGAEPLKKEEKESFKPPKKEKKISRSHIPPIPQESFASPPKNEASVDPIQNLDRKTSRKIRKERIEIDATLDLHGLTQTEAYGKLSYFIPNSQARGHKLILVITGKGSSRSYEKVGVLRNNVPQWLQNKASFPQVLSISSAQPQHGGNGAFYVFLRKK